MKNKTIYEYLLSQKILTKKEFQDLFSVRAIKINDVLLTDPSMIMGNINKITIGMSVVDKVFL